MLSIFSEKQEETGIGAIAATIPTIEEELIRLKGHRLEEQDSAPYISLLAKPTLQSSDDTLFSLMERTLAFLAGPGLVFLLLGDSGGGKSTFNLQLERTLWNKYKRGDPIPLHISLPFIDNPQQDIIGRQLRRLDFSDTQIMELKQNRQFIVICDGYDESQLTTNLHTTNDFNQPGQWRVKMVVTCRTQYLGSNYHSRFVPQEISRYNRPAPNLFQEAVIAPFTKEQIKKYVDIYVTLEPRTWRVQDYMDRLTTIPNLLDLASNPFLLTLALETLPGITEGEENLSTVKITRVQLYDAFVANWLNVNKPRLETNALSAHDRDIFHQLQDAGFISMGLDYSMRLALAIFDEQDGNPVVHYVHSSDEISWKTDFFGPQPEVRLLRESSPLTRTDNQFRFVHRSMLEYFLSRVIYNPVDNQECDPQTDIVSSVATLIDSNGLLFRRDLLPEPSIIQFLCDRVKSHPDFEHELRRVVSLSKTDSSAITAATNAITIVVQAGALFNGADLRGIKIPGADLSDGQFDSAQLQGADLRNVILTRSWLRQVDLSGARLEGVRFGELPYLDLDNFIQACAYSPNGRMLAVGFYQGNFSIYDTSTWIVIRRFTTDTKVRDIAFSPNNEQIVSAGGNGTARIWDCISGEEVISMGGHTRTVLSVVFSPCGKQIASAGKDGTVRLWDSQTGASQFVLEGHTKRIWSVKYSPNGCQLVSGSEDETIRFWDPETGEPGAVLSVSLGGILCLAYSSDGRRIASGHRKNVLQLWDTATRELGTVLRGHSDPVRGVEFSPNGQKIVSCSDDKTVRLWDAYSGSLLSTWAGHSSCASSVAFSPDGLQIASSGLDKKVRLWDVGSTWSSLDPRDGGRVNQIAYASDGRTILAQASCRVLQKWDAGTGASSESILFEFFEPQVVLSMAFTRDGSQFAVGYEDGSIHLWNNQIAGPILKDHTYGARSLVYSPCCRWIACVTTDYDVWLWDLHNMERHCILVELDFQLEEIIRAVAFSPTSNQLAVGPEYATIHLFDLPSTEHLTCSKVTEFGLVSMVYSPNGRQMAIGDTVGCIYLWDLQSEKPGVKLSGHTKWIRCIAYSPCGQWIASSYNDNTVGIWHRQLWGEVDSWSRVHSIRSFFGPVDNIAWNPFVHMEFVTSCRDGSIRVWRLPSDEGVNVAVKMLWGLNLRILCADDLTLDNVIGISPFNLELLVQRGAVSPITNKDEGE